MPSRWTLTGTLLAGLLACGGGGDETTAAATDASTGGTGGGSEGGTTASPTNEPTTDPTTGGASQSGTDTTAESSTGPGPTTIPEPTTEVDESSTGPVTTDPETDTGSTETTETTDPDTSGSTGEPPGLCPPTPDDSECATCTKARCCDELMACFADEDCGCITGCLAMGGDPMTCGMQCMVNPMGNEFLMALRACNNMKCSDVCMMP